MTEPTVPPALTAEEWRKRLANPWTGALVDFGHCSCGAPVVRNLWDPSLPPRMGHQLAALALHGQPFGFTHADVRRLRKLRVDEEWGPTGDDTEFASPDVANAYGWLASLADRIAALLPPEGTDDAR